MTAYGISPVGVDGDLEVGRVSAQQELARRRAALRIGVTYDEYEERRAGGERWCSAHRRWHPEGDFPHAGAYCRTGLRKKERTYRQRLWEEERNWLLARVLAK